MRIALALVLFASVLTIAKATAQSDPLQCRSYASQMAQAQNNRERLSELLNHPRASDCPQASAQGRAFLRALTPAPAVAPRPDAGEPAAWQLAVRVNSRAAYQAYIDQFPNGANAGEARRRIRAAAPAQTRGPPAVAAPEETREERAPVRQARGQEFDDCNGDAWCPRMIIIPAGNYTIGSPATERERIADEAQRPMSIRSFAIGKFELTAAQWQACVAAGGCSRATTGSGDQAATYIDWDDAQEYVRWLSQRTGHTYRLPSEAEWEYAARAGSTTAYWWGEDSPVCEEGVPNGAAFGVQCPVGSQLAVGRFQPNPFGLYDVHGNVWEIVQDCYAPIGAMAGDGTANVSNGCAENGGFLGVGARGMSTVMRGGGWIDPASRLRSAQREAIYRHYRHRHTGIRVARDL